VQIFENSVNEEFWATQISTRRAALDALHALGCPKPPHGSYDAVTRDVEDAKSVDRLFSLKECVRVAEAVCSRRVARILEEEMLRSWADPMNAGEQLKHGSEARGSSHL
jgi:hypothetical protein